MAWPRLPHLGPSWGPLGPQAGPGCWARVWPTWAKPGVTTSAQVGTTRAAQVLPGYVCTPGEHPCPTWASPPFYMGCPGVAHAYTWLSQVPPGHARVFPVYLYGLKLGYPCIHKCFGQLILVPNSCNQGNPTSNIFK